MKIQKFNENTNKNFFYCAIMYDSQIDQSYIFDDEDDMDNWILNYVNSELPKELDWILDDYVEHGLYKIDDDEYVFLYANDALRWFNSDGGRHVEILYDLNVDILKDVKLKYNVEQLRNTKKYNL